ncbi:MAG TPA: glycosyltransferase family 2 protein, partial [Candidatus Paceibacterota bacterium]
MKSISLVIPIYNEEENIKPLFREIEEVMSVNAIDYEIIAINDGSFDSSGSQLREEAKRSPYIKIISLNRNYGQTAAMSAGFHCATHGIVIPLDADMQNDPRDIPRLIEVMDSGFDIVSGWRKERKDKTLSRKIPSWIANSIISRITGVHLHDYG